MSRYEKHIFVCTNVRGADAGKPSCNGDHLVELFKSDLQKYGISPRSVRVNRSGCLGACELGPTVVVYPDGVWYRNVRTAEDVDEIVRSHILADLPVERLRIS